MTHPVTLSLISKHHETGNIWSFRFRPSRPLSWVAGQFIRVELPHPNSDTEGTKRFFTIASPPHEAYVQISTRITASSFKQALSRLEPSGILMLLDHPAGDFLWPAPAPRYLLLAAQGIGITPFYSMLASRVHHAQPLAATLLYTNRSDAIPFLDQLQSWATSHPEFRLIFSSDRINTATLTRLELGFPLSHSQIYVSGPSNLLTLLGPPHNLKPTQLKQDFFPNYASPDY
jgi:ferredoxin-NADP reductase